MSEVLAPRAENLWLANRSLTSQHSCDAIFQVTLELFMIRSISYSSSHSLNERNILIYLYFDNYVLQNNLTSLKTWHHFNGFTNVVFDQSIDWLTSQFSQLTGKPLVKSKMPILCPSREWPYSSLEVGDGGTAPWKLHTAGRTLPL